jgi:DUF1680 family protein
MRRVVAAQEPDGYLSTTFGRPGQGTRYSDLQWGHELHCFGHLVQACVARARTHGEDELVRVSVRATTSVMPRVPTATRMCAATRSDQCEAERCSGRRSDGRPKARSAVQCPPIRGGA